MSRRNMPALRAACYVACVSLICSAGSRTVLADGPQYSIGGMGLFDASHTRDDGYQYSQLQHTATTGFAAGYSVRYNGNSTAGESAWVYDASTNVSTRIGMIDPTGQERWSSHPLFLNNGGQVAGVSDWSKSSANDKWSWFYDAATTTQTRLGFYDDDYTRDDNEQQTTEVQGLTQSGHAFGNSMRFAGSSYVGRAVWAFDSDNKSMTRIGLFDADYTHQTSGEQLSEFRAANSTGFATGLSWLFPTNASSTAVAWAYNSETAAIRRIGMNAPSGGLWQYGHDAILGVTEDNVVFGHFHLDSSHQAIWAYNDTTYVTTRTGLFDAEHTDSSGKQYTYDVAWNSKGNAFGRSYRYDSRRNGYSAWTYDPATATTKRLGFTDAEHTTSSGDYQNSWGTAINNSGMVIGGSQRLGGPEGTTSGQTAWLYDPANDTTTKLGNRDVIPGTSNYHHNSAWAINDRGQVVGATQQTSGYRGAAMWMYDSESAATRQIGLWDAMHTYRDENFQEGGLFLLTDSGIAAGYTNRLGIAPFSDSSGKTAWLYDWDSDTTTTLVFSESSKQHAETIVSSITDDGVVIGKYRLYEGDESEVIYRNFVGTLSDGFFDLQSLVDSGLAANGWKDIADGVFDLGQLGGFRATADGNLALNRFGGMGERLDGSIAPYIMQPVPEPSMLALWCVGALGIGGVWWRRRRAK